jgi:hypothetical protein
MTSSVGCWGCLFWGWLWWWWLGFQYHTQPPACVLAKKRQGRASLSDIHIPAVVCLVIEAVCLKYQLNASHKTLSPESTVACRLSEARRSRQVWHNWHTHASTMKFLNSTSQSESNFNSRWPRYPGLRFAGCYSR